MSRTKNTQLLAIASALNLLVTSIGTIIIGRLLLVFLGSEYNGINSIISQFLTIISVLEGGLTTASLVAMMRPYQQKDTAQVNQLFAETKARFYRVSSLALAIGIVGAIVYGYAVKTTIPDLTVILVLIVGLTGSVYTIGITTKYRLIFQAAQEEHIFAFITLCTTILGQLGMIVALTATHNVVVMRLVGMLATVLAGCLARRAFVKRYPVASHAKWDGTMRIKGTKDVLAGKIVAAIHSASTAMFLSVFSNAAITSVYAVYNTIIHAITAMVNICFTAPQNAIGQILQGDDHEKKQSIVLEFEYTVILILTILFVPVGLLIVPFVRIYTQGITDVEYVDYTLAVLMVLSTYLQLIHIPAGTCIYMSGNFKSAKNIQLIALVVLLVGNLILGKLMGMYGFLLSMMLCNAFLAVCEIVFVHKKILHKAIAQFLLMWMPHVLLTGILIVLGSSLVQFINGFVSWIVAACIITMITLAATAGLNMIIFKTYFGQCIKRIKGFVQRKK